MVLKFKKEKCKKKNNIINNTVCNLYTLTLTCSSKRNFLLWVCSSKRSTYSFSSSISSFTCCTVSNSCLICTISRFTSDTSLWQLSTDLVSSWSWVRISHNATVVSIWRSPLCKSSNLADKFILITLTCFCKLLNLFRAWWWWWGFGSLYFFFSFNLFSFCWMVEVQGLSGVMMVVRSKENKKIVY